MHLSFIEKEELIKDNLINENEWDSERAIDFLEEVSGFSRQELDEIYRSNFEMFEKI